MNEIYRDETAVVYNNDMEEIINDDLKFDYVLTDPPYNCGYKYPDYKDNMADIDYINLLSNLNEYPTIMIHYPEEFCGNVGEAMGKPNKMVQWVYNSNLQRQHRSIAWYNCRPDFKKIRMPYKDMKDKRNIELMANGSGGRKIYDWWDDINLIKNSSKEKATKFTNQIPIRLLERILILTTDEGDTILDPFFGSGSLYFACKNTNRKCIGIEQSAIHLDSFLSRLN